jgi:hypothetical protein
MILSKFIAKWLHFSYRIKTNRKKFTEIYDHVGFSGVGYPPSGIGSTLEATEIIREWLPLFLKDYGVRSFIDAPCGDFTWMKKINLSGFEYHGFDIVRSIVEQNRSYYAQDNIRFDELDIVKQSPPLADLILCRDCFVHLSNRDVQKTLSNFRLSGSKYLLTTTFNERRENSDLVSGRGWRPINLESPPFNFPNPIRLVNENCTELDGEYSDKCLGLWKLDTLDYTRR